MPDTLTPPGKRKTEAEIKIRCTTDSNLQYFRLYWMTLAKILSKRDVRTSFVGLRNMGFGHAFFMAPKTP